MVEAQDAPGADPQGELLKRLEAKGPQDARYKLHGEVARGGLWLRRLILRFEHV